MGVSGNFWNLLKPYARFEGVDFLRDKRAAVDLSFWIVQHDAAIRSRNPRVRSPHIRVTFFRTLALFTKLGAFPVFVVDGEPSPLKNRARMERFLRGSGLEISALARPSEAAANPSKPRNRVFSAWVQECVELLEILGMPVLKAQSEAEAFCAQLNNGGHVDACITSDSDAFLFGAKCVIKCLRSNSKEPFECYYMSDIQAGLGLKRKQMIAIALLVGNDYDLHGVPGFGVETALRFVKLFSEDEVLDRLSEVGKGTFPSIQKGIESSLDHDASTLFEAVATSKSKHCSHCGHPGSKRTHLKIACEYCIHDGSESCILKSTGFKCHCSDCCKEHEIIMQRKQENWQLKACEKIAAELDFPNKEIIEMYLNARCHDDEGNCELQLRWAKPDVGNLVVFLECHQKWQPSYTKQRLLPMLSTMFLREAASGTAEGQRLLFDKYEFHSIGGVKIRCGCPHYLVKWREDTPSLNRFTYSISQEELEHDRAAESAAANESADPTGDADDPMVLVDDGCWFLVTLEHAELVKAAFPNAVEKFLREKVSAGKSKSGPVQLSLSEFYRSVKPVAREQEEKKKKKKKKRSRSQSQSQSQSQVGESSNSDPKRVADSDQEIPKSVRRRIFFE